MPMSALNSDNPYQVVVDHRGPLMPRPKNSKLDMLLIDAERGDLKAIKDINRLELPKRIHKKDEDGRTALHRACAAGHREVARYLMRVGGDTNMCDDEDWGPLHTAASNGDSHMVETLICHKADPNLSTSSGSTPLHFAASKGDQIVIMLLMQAGAYKNARDSHGGTPLHRACSAGHKRMVRTLLDAKADPTLKDGAGDNVLHMALKGQHVDVCGELMTLDMAEELMEQDNFDVKSPASLLADMQPIEVRDTIKAIWKEGGIHGG